MTKIYSPTYLVFYLVLFSYGCRTTPQTNPSLTAEDSLRIVSQIASHRREVDSFFRLDPSSPFRIDTSIRYEGVKWFPPDLKYYFRSKLYRYQHPATVSIFGTKGEERRELQYGYFILHFEEKDFKLNVYKFSPSDRAYMGHQNLLSIWFTDETTGKETYGVGRYVEAGDEHPDSEHTYDIDFNQAYNPYCAYSSLFSCAIPRKEDHLDFAVRAGELNYHH